MLITRIVSALRQFVSSSSSPTVMSPPEIHPNPFAVYSQFYFARAVDFQQHIMRLTGLKPPSKCKLLYLAMNMEPEGILSSGLAVENGSG